MDKREALKQKINEKKMQRTKRDVIIKKIDKHEENQVKKQLKEEKNLTIDTEMPPLEEI
jgi:hypothetical protein